MAAKSGSGKRSKDAIYATDTTAKDQRIAELENHIAVLENALSIKQKGPSSRGFYERLRAEEALCESKERFDYAIRAAREGIWDWNMETDECYYSPRYKEMLGYAEDEIEPHASAWLRLIHPDDRERAQKVVDSVMHGEREYEMEFRMRHKDGHYVDILSRGYPLRRKSDGKIVRIVGTHFDITERNRVAEELRQARDGLEKRVRERTAELTAEIAERKRVEDTLRQAEEFSRRVIASSADCINVLDLDGNLLSMSEGGQSLLEISDLSRYLNKSWVEFWQAQDQADVRSAIATARAGGTGTFQAYCPSEKGTPKWWDVIITPIHAPDGRIEKLLAVSRDITNRKRAEEALRESENRFRQLADNSPIPMAINDKDDNITYLNKKFIETFGYTLEDVPNLSSWWPRAYPDPGYREEAIKRWEKGVEEAVRESKEIGPIDYVVTCKDGSVRYTEIFGAPIGDKELVLLQDVTERRQAEEGRRKLIHDLGERVKEQKALHSIAGIFQLPRAVSGLLQEVVSVLPSAWQYPDVTSARITYGGREYRSALFRESPWRQSADFSTSDGKRGSIEVYYTEEMPPEAEGPFLSEERSMIDTVADMLRTYLDRKLAEETLRESEANLSRAQALSHIGNWYIDPETELGSGSDEFFHILGIGRQDAVSFSEFLKLVHPDDRARVKAIFDETKRTHVQEDFEFRSIRSDGEERVIFLTGEFTHDGEGRPRIIGTIQDITERKRAEDALRESESNLARAQLLTHLGNWTWDLKCDRVEGSAEFFRLFSFADGQYISYFEFLDRLHPDDREPVDRAVQATLSGATPYSIDYRIALPGGAERIIHAEGEVTRDRAGQPITMFGTAQDVTERRRAEKALMEAKARAELYLDLMGHDINNMNQSVMGFLELALQTLDADGKIGRDGRLLIEKPLQAVQGSSRLISNVRKLQRLADEGVKTRPIDLHDLFEELRSLDFHVGDRDATINVQEVPHWLVDASDLLRDVFLNLISNAVKHTEPDRPVFVDVGVERVELDGRAYYRCTVEDDGPGVPDGLKPKLFHRFQRGKTQAHGRGLGLYLVRTLVESYGGRVWVEDRVKGDHTKGARFVVMLPAAIGR